MKQHSETLVPPAVLRLRTIAYLISCASLVGHAPARGQDASKALNIFQQLVRPAQNAAPTPALSAAPVSPGGLLGNALGGNTAGKGVASAGQAADLFSLLSQSTEQIDEAKELEIGRQLAAVLLGSKPLHPDMALQRYVNQLGRWISLQSSRAPESIWHDVT